jgi:hypothetical protein
MQRLNTLAQIAGILFGLISLAFLTPSIPTVAERFLLWAALAALVTSAVNLARAICARAEDKRRAIDNEALQLVVDDTIELARAISEKGQAASKPDRMVH